MLTRRQSLTLLAGGALASGAFGGYACAYEPLYRLHVARYALTPRGWTPGLKVRVVALADVHACEPWMSAARIHAICDAANALDGDIVVLLGDYVAGMALVSDHVAPADWAKSLSRLRAPLGVHAVLGNHDWWDDPEAQSRGGGETVAHRALREAGIAVYSNRSARLEKDGFGFWLAGLEDQIALLPTPSSGRLRLRGLHDLVGTLRQVTRPEPVILMAHEPDIFARMPARVSLTLAGHTHGGQVRLFGHAPVVPSAYGTRYAYGHVREQGRDIVISGGLGCTGLPIRFGCPPEITMIELG